MYTLQDLFTLMQHLRDPEGGCPWDQAQNFLSLSSHTLEEAYEVVDAIERQDWPHLQEELGDLLFQVIFYAQLGQEGVQGADFSFAQIVDTLVQKMLRRHPHVFPDGTLASAQHATSLSEAQVHQHWETLKAQEKPQAKGLLADIPLALPGLTRAAKIQKKAARVGFDWPDIQGALAKVYEELQELEQALATENLTEAQQEYGDLLFACTNLSRFLQQDPEAALRRTQAKFSQRFAYIETQLQTRGLSFAQVSLEQMDAWWEEAKLQE
ncbi:ATP diphosphatase [Allopseudospirillum japonicum]|uniref:Nucleoside triphosphate pyrophosphohydrolase n=1 Tax=Allopseudospirillum japonicum TaxID=64971 RepID=A0A1H6UH25_9GAMM|nr:nucleoside triphosphate pyrophosphohydrolase [Allopseudospirillum japonicum]SEI91629.1 ATP diphosphatase [Allopseudospirillum japonicum]